MVGSSCLQLCLSLEIKALPLTRRHQASLFYAREISFANQIPATLHTLVYPLWFTCQERVPKTDQLMHLPAAIASLLTRRQRGRGGGRGGGRGDMDDDRDRGSGGGRTGGGRGGNNGGNTNTSTTKASTPDRTTTAKDDPPPATATHVAPTEAASSTNPPDTKPAPTQAPVVNSTATEAQKPSETQKQDEGVKSSTASSSPAAPTPTQRTAPGSGEGSGQGNTAGSSNGNSRSTPTAAGGNRNGASSNGGGANSGSQTGSSEAGKGTGASVAGGAVVGGSGATGTNGIGSGSGSNSSGASGASNGGSSSKGPSGGVIAGAVVGSLALLALLALLLFLFRRKPKVQRFLAVFRRGGGGGGGRSRNSYPTYHNGPDGMGNNLLESGSGPQGPGMSAAGFAAAPVMRQMSRGARPPLLPLSANSNRISSPTGESLNSRGFTPSPISPISPASVLSPPAHGGAPVPYPGRPQYVPPSPTIPRPTQPRVMHVANLSSGGHAAPFPVAGYRQPREPSNPQPQAQNSQQQLQPQHARGGSVGSASTTSALSAIINPQMLWPMPPATPTSAGRWENGQQHQRGGGSAPQNGGRAPGRQPHLVDFERSGLTVVKITRQPTGGRRPAAGRTYQ